jgi:hypothetical protein
MREMTSIVDFCDKSAIGDIFQTMVFIGDISPARRRTASTEHDAGQRVLIEE